MRSGLQWLGRVPLSRSCHLGGAMLFNCACGGVFVTAIILQNLGETKIVIGDGFVLTTLREAKSQQWQHQRQVPCSPDHTCCWRKGINETIYAHQIFASNTQHQHCISCRKLICAILKKWLRFGWDPHDNEDLSQIFNVVPMESLPPGHHHAVYRSPTYPRNCPNYHPPAKDGLQAPAGEEPCIWENMHNCIFWPASQSYTLWQRKKPQLLLT